MIDDSTILGKDINIDIQILNYKNKNYLTNFNCGNENIDKYFHNYALNDVNTATHMFIDTDKDIAIALVSMSCSKVDFWQDGEYLCSTPAVEIKYFATDERYHSLPFEYKEDNNTLSKVVMSKVVWNIYDDLTKKIGASIIILNSVEKAIHFYENCGFEVYNVDMNVSYECIEAKLTPMFLSLKPDI